MSQNDDLPAPAFREVDWRPAEWRDAFVQAMASGWWFNSLRYRQDDLDEAAP